MTHRAATTILDLNAASARDLLMDPKAYCTIPLPHYFSFKEILEAARSIQGKWWSRRIVSKAINNDVNCPKDAQEVRSIYDGVNYRILSNKDGQISWRPFEIINPVLYTDLVYKITEPDNWTRICERFETFRKDGPIECCSMLPGHIKSAQKKSILNWWNNFEQRSVELALEYPVQIQTDISDCYGSLYTHTIAWALHGKGIAKKKQRDKNLLGNQIDARLQDMSSGQTNGIPQGSMLSDFLAEIVLGYADFLLSERVREQHLNRKRFKILRYRDDYRIFAGTREICQELLLSLMQILADLNFKLGASKTLLTDDVALSSVKKDKVNWLRTGSRPRALHKRLLVLGAFSREFPQSGTLSRELSSLYERVERISSRPDHNAVLISQIVDLMARNPRCYPMGCAIISQLLQFEDDADKKSILLRVINRCRTVPNRGLFEIWLQRISWRDTLDVQFEESLCNCIIVGQNYMHNPWRFEWLHRDDRALMEAVDIVSIEAILKEHSAVISRAEAGDFNEYSGITRA